MGDQSGQKGNIRGSQWRVKQLVHGRQDRVRPTQRGVPRPCTPQSDVFTGAHRAGLGQGVLVLEHGIWRADPGRALLLAEKRQPWGMGMRHSTTRNACGESAFVK